MRPGVVVLRPKLRWHAPPRTPLVKDDVRAAAPALGADLDALDRVLLPDYYDFDESAQRAQNTFRLGQVLIIAGGATATALGAVQAALGGGVAWLGIAGAIIAGALTGGVAYVRGQHAQQDYFTDRLKAERLRSEYFLFLGRLAPYDAASDDERVARLRERVGLIATQEQQ
jgi:Protein of unknown function (DUF4231)